MVLLEQQAEIRNRGHMICGPFSNDPGCRNEDDDGKREDGRRLSSSVPKGNPRTNGFLDGFGPSAGKKPRYTQVTKGGDGKPRAMVKAGVDTSFEGYKRASASKIRSETRAPMKKGIRKTDQSRADFWTRKYHSGNNPL